VCLFPLRRFSSPRTVDTFRLNLVPEFTLKRIKKTYSSNISVQYKTALSYGNRLKPSEIQTKCTTYRNNKETPHVATKCIYVFRMMVAIYIDWCCDGHILHNITLLTKMAQCKNKLVAEAHYTEFHFHFIKIYKPRFQSNISRQLTLPTQLITQCSVAFICPSRFHPPLLFKSHVPQDALDVLRLCGWRFNKSSGTSTLLWLPDNEDGSTTFLRNVNSLPVDRTSHPTRFQSLSSWAPAKYSNRQLPKRYKHQNCTRSHFILDSIYTPSPS
jgi:hypothetical protein